MKKYLYIIILTLGFSLTGCGFFELFVDKDDTANTSMISYKPELTLKGEAIISITAGGNYADAGCDVEVGPDSINVHEVSIVEGNPDPNTLGFYVVTYKAENGFGWATYAYRAVLVHDGTPYSLEIGGNYKKGFLYYTSISKYDIDGYWKIDNVWQEDGVEMPVIFADKGDGINYTVVPGEHPTKGRYDGTAVKSGTKITFTIHSVSSTGVEATKTFDWTKY